ncbi:hypothetical protein MMC30_000049 [Trapelia coarctata]|nr:hypothetical protein [Trapelia coarctata]
MSSIALKITSLLIRTLSKPIANRIKAQAREHPQFRGVCVSIAQSIHRLDMRLRLGLLQDQAAIDRQIAREAAEAQAKKAKAEIPTVKTEAQTKADEAAALKEKEKGGEKAKSTSAPKVRIRPLSEAKAIDSGATFISETFLFGVALSTIMFEAWRRRREEVSRRSDVSEKLQELEEKDRAKTALLEELQHEVEELRSARGYGGSSWFWGSKNPPKEPAKPTPGGPTKGKLSSPSNIHAHDEWAEIASRSESGTSSASSNTTATSSASSVKPHSAANANTPPKSPPAETADTAVATSTGGNPPNPSPSERSLIN